MNGHTDLVKLADAMGVAGCHITEQKDLVPMLSDALAREGAMLVDIEVPPEEEVLPMVPGGKRLDEMVLGVSE